MDFHHRKTLAVTLLQDLFTKNSKKRRSVWVHPILQKPWGILPADPHCSSLRFDLSQNNEGLTSHKVQEIPGPR